MSTTVDLPPTVSEALAMVDLSPSGEIVFGERTTTTASASELHLTLTRWFYEHLHLGWTSPRNGSIAHREPHLERHLSAGLTLPPTVTQATVLTSETGAGDVVVGLDGLRVLVPASEVLSRTTTGSGLDVTFRMPALRAAVSPGFLLLDRSAGVPEGSLDRRVYVHVTDSDAARQIWSSVVHTLDRLDIPYVTKVLSILSQYPRTDAIVVYLVGDAPAVRTAIAESVAGRSGLGPSVSLFAAQVGTGVATAAEPIDDRPGMRGLSFGLHRASVLARAVARSRFEALDLGRVVIEELTAARVDPSDLSANR